MEIHQVRTWDCTLDGNVSRETRYEGTRALLSRHWTEIHGAREEENALVENVSRETKYLGAQPIYSRTGQKPSKSGQFETKCFT